VFFDGTVGVAKDGMPVVLPKGYGREKGEDGK